MLGKVGLPNDQIANEGGSFFHWVRNFTNTSFADFTNGRFDEKKGG